MALHATRTAALEGVTSPQSELDRAIDGQGDGLLRDKPVAELLCEAWRSYVIGTPAREKKSIPWLRVAEDMRRGVPR